MDEALRYLIARHRYVAARYDLYTSPGNGCPGFAESLQRDMRGLEASIAGLVKTATIVDASGWAETSNG